MKARLFIPVLATLVLFGACSDSPNSSEPVNDQQLSVMNHMDDLRLNDEQSLLLDEMFILEEDLSILLDNSQLQSFNGLKDGLYDGRDDRRFPDMRRGIDIAALVYYNLILKANPDLDEDTKEALKELIKKSMQYRLRLLGSDMDREKVMRLLKEEHEKLMAMMNRLIGKEAMANVQRLIERLQQDRKELRDKWTAVRIQKQVEMMKRALELTDEQGGKITRILTWQHEQIQLLREKYRDDPEGFRNALIRLHMKVQDMINGRLTPEQLRRWEAMKTGDRDKRDDRDDREISPVKQKVDLMTRLLGLDREQVASLTRLLTWQQQQILEIKKKFANDPRGMKQALMELQQKFDRQLAGILTAEQMKKWEAWKKSQLGDKRG